MVSTLVYYRCELKFCNIKNKSEKTCNLQKIHTLNLSLSPLKLRNLMFLDWISKLNFFEHNKESSIFLSFPKSIRRDVCNHIVSHLLKEESGQKDLTSRQHIIVMMEIIGQAFGLDISDEPVIKMCIQIYRNWLLDGPKPPLIDEDKDFFVIEIIKHFSLLFSDRHSGNSKTHAVLCTDVLEIINLAFSSPSTFKTETWESLLKILLAICDNILKVPESDSVFSTLLCPQLLKSMFSLWIRSSTTNDILWDHFRDLISRWKHRMPVINQWVATCTGLTNAVINLLYVTHAQTGTVIIQSIGTSEIIEIDQSFILYSWYRVLHLLGDLETLKNSSIYAEAIKGIHINARQFYYSLNVKSTKVSPPDGNSILHIYGPFLFESITNMRVGFDEGNIEALRALILLFVSKPETNFDMVYLSTLYYGLLKALERGKPYIDTVLLDSPGLFTNNLKGCMTLIPSYWKAIKKILNIDSNTKTLRQSSELLNSIYRISSYLLTLSTVYSNLPLNQICGNDGLTEYERTFTFNELKDLSDLLTQCLVLESSDHNKVRLLTTLYLYILENNESLGNFPYNLVSKLTKAMIEHEWSFDIIEKVLHFLSDLSYIYHKLKKDNKDLPELIINTVCDYLEILFSIKHIDSSKNESLIISCYQCLQVWVMKDQWIISNKKRMPKEKSSLFKVLTYAFIGKTGRRDIRPGMMTPDPQSDPTIFKLTSNISSSAEYLITIILNQLDNYPSSSFPEISSMLSEEDFITDKVKKIRFYILENRIITLISHQDDNSQNVSTTLIVRDATGKYVWRNVYENVQQPIYTSYTPTIIDDTSFLQRETLEIDNFLVEDLYYLLSETEKSNHDIIMQKLKDRIEYEKKHLNSTNFGLKDKITLRNLSLQPRRYDDNSSSRIFALHLGWNTISNRSRFFAVKDSYEEIKLQLKKLDHIRERECMSFGVVYIPFDGEQQIFSCDKASSSFEDFVNGLGWEIDLYTHTGFNGNMNPKANGPTTIYYSDYNYEVVYHVSTMMQYHSQTAQHFKRRLLLSNKVMIIWVESPISNKNIPLIKGSESVVQIFIHPINSILYRIRIFKHSSVPNFGPIEDDIVVSKHVLSFIVRLTAINAYMSASKIYNFNAYKRRDENIKVLIEDFNLITDFSEYNTNIIY